MYGYPFRAGMVAIVAGRRFASVADLTAIQATVGKIADFREYHRPDFVAVHAAVSPVAEKPPLGATRTLNVNDNPMVDESTNRHTMRRPANVGIIIVAEFTRSRRRSPSRPTAGSADSRRRGLRCADRCRADDTWSPTGPRDAPRRSTDTRRGCRTSRRRGRV